MEELKDKILKVFFDFQCYEDDGSINDDETPLVLYRHLEKQLSLSKKELQPTVLKLRNEGLIELTVAINQDYNPSGSGWLLTLKGEQYCKKFVTRSN